MLYQGIFDSKAGTNHTYDSDSPQCFSQSPILLGIICMTIEMDLDDEDFEDFDEEFFSTIDKVVEQYKAKKDAVWRDTYDLY